jgi:hypothetical protein
LPIPFYLWYTQKPITTTDSNYGLENLNNANFNDDLLTQHNNVLVSNEEITTDNNNSLVDNKTEFEALLQKRTNYFQIK